MWDTPIEIRQHHQPVETPLGPINPEAFAVPSARDAEIEDEEAMAMAR